MSTTEIKKKKREFPHVLIILLAMCSIMLVLTWIIPAGSFDREINDMGRSVVVPGSFHYVESSRLGITSLFTSLYDGMVAGAGIIAFILLVVGSFNVINETGAINAGLAKISYRMRGREKLMIPVLMVVFALASNIIGMGEECYPFIPIVVAAALSMGFDSFTGVLIVILGCSAGFTGAFLCPFTVGLAQGLAELPAFSGMGLRICLFVAMNIVMIAFVWRYANKIKKNPELSISYESDKERREALLANMGEEKKLTKREIAILIVFIAGMIFFAYGVVKLVWGFAQMTAAFVILGLLCGLISGMSLNEYAKSMVRGVTDVAYIVLLIAFARAILIILENGQILDTILYHAAQVLDLLPPSLSAIGMYIFQCLLSFVVGGSSAHATLTMPLMVPMADMVGITRQTAVLAWQMGDSLSNVWLPTAYSAAAMGMAGIPWQKYFKWYIPCMVVQYVIGAIFIVIAVSIGYGPF